MFLRCLNHYYREGLSIGERLFDVLIPQASLWQLGAPFLFPVLENIPCSRESVSQVKWFVYGTSRILEVDTKPTDFPSACSSHDGISP